MIGKTRCFRAIALAALGVFSLSSAAVPEVAPEAAPKAVPQEARLGLMPYPKHLQLASGTWTLNPDATLVISHPENPNVAAALARFQQRFERQTGVALTLVDDKDLDRELAAEKAAEKSQRLTIQVTGPAKDYHDNTTIPLDALTQEREAYRLRISADTIDLEAPSHLGVNHGLETLLQLLAEQGEPAHTLTLPALTISDAPRFRWRGLMLDSVRHFFSVDTIKRQLDGMAAAKLNIFHWHLTDDQGWRLESKHYPKLHEEASDGLYYTQEDIKEIVAYAMARGIQVVPEIDMPGHASAVAVAYPELMSAPGPYEMEDRWGVHTPLLNPANPEVYAFADKIFAEVAALFPFEYVHVGGDEVNPRDWIENEEIQTFMKRKNLGSPEDLHTYFNQRLAAILGRYDRKMIGWDEILHPQLPEGTAVQSWRGPDALGEIANQGHPAILSTGFYVDQPQPAAYHYRNPIFPAPLRIEDQPGADERWETWTFELPRKRGNAITGTFTLIEHPQQGLRGFIEFAGKSRQALNDLETRHGITYFRLDTWMGPVLGRLERNAGKLGGDMVVSNAAYPASGEQIAGSEMPGTNIPEPPRTPAVDEAKRHWVLGGEAALWSEIVDERHIDLRLWPRLFVVAERLWSSAELTDETSMYQRLAKVADWAERSVGLQHRQQSQVALDKLVPATQLTAAAMLTEALEPAQYYHRHHEKSVHGTYSRRDPLDLFVDTLPPENLTVRKLANQLERWRQNPGDQVLERKVRATLVSWQDNTRQLLDRLQREKDPAQLRSHAEQVYNTASWGLILMDSLRTETPLDPSVARFARCQLRLAQAIDNEVVVAAAYPVERLLDEIPLSPTE